jgi:hypothetical protein
MFDYLFYVLLVLPYPLAHIPPLSPKGGLFSHSDNGRSFIHFNLLNDELNVEECLSTTLKINSQEKFNRITNAGYKNIQLIVKNI